MMSLLRGQQGGRVPRVGRREQGSSPPTSALGRPPPQERLATDPPDGRRRLPRLVYGRPRPRLERPTFAPIAAVIVLGLAVGERLRRALELTLAVAFGVAMADLLLSVAGVGAVQAGVFVVLAMGLTVFLGGGELGVNEAAISAMIIMFTYTPSAAGFPIDRFLEALIGGGTALLINALMPVNPERMVEDAAFPVFDESTAVLEEVADALEDGDARRVQRSYVKARAIDARVSGLKEAVEAGRETARLAPPRRGSLGHMELYASAADQIDLTVRDVRALARAALSVVQPEAEDPVPERLPA